MHYISRRSIMCQAILKHTYRRSPHFSRARLDAPALEEESGDWHFIVNHYYIRYKRLRCTPCYRLISA